jgi:hypothetical protein
VLGSRKLRLCEIEIAESSYNDASKSTDQVSQSEFDMNIILRVCVAVVVSKCEFAK